MHARLAPPQGFRALAHGRDAPVFATLGGPETAMGAKTRLRGGNPKVAGVPSKLQRAGGRRGGGVRGAQGLPCQGMSESLRLTIVYEDGGDGWVVASIPEVPGALSQGHTRQEARENVIDALHGILELRFGEHALSEPASDSEPIELTIAA
jgi:predicted RNase H-like HicB family nuclease